jgi:lipopolysaccharide/colanic/teichoic acid biosynthesis glycosyltransferase
MKRVFDITLALSLLAILWLPLIVISILISLQDYKSPLYLAPRVSKNNGEFTMIKLRTMIHNADKNQVDSTQSNDMRITKIGSFVRKLKLDELIQIINVLNGTMSFVGPRPQVRRDVDLYTDQEKVILTAKPGITDFSSIVFSDEGDILEGNEDPDISYNQLIRPWKSRLIIVYIENRSIFLDIQLIFLTAYNFINRKKTLHIISNILKKLGASNELQNIALRKEKLIPMAPLGSSEIVSSRKINIV